VCGNALKVRQLLEIHRPPPRKAMMSAILISDGSQRNFMFA